MNGEDRTHSGNSSSDGGYQGLDAVEVEEARRRAAQPSVYTTLGNFED